MLQINVSQLLKEPIGATRNYIISEEFEIADGDYLIQGEIKLMRTDRSVLAQGILHTEIELVCGRCLSLFLYPLTLNIEEEYLPTIDVLTGVPLPEPDEPEHLTIDERNILDLAETIRQYGLMAVPMKALCREDCAGLCPTCGHNLNEGSCDCSKKPVEPRWSELDTLVLTDN